LNKKKQKNFDHFWPVALERLREAEWPWNDFAKRSKSFLVLFFKKELLVFTYFFNF